MHVIILVKVTKRNVGNYHKMVAKRKLNSVREGGGHKPACL